MSKEFFEIMEEISTTATKIKFLEGTYPEIYNKYSAFAENIKIQIIKIEKQIIKDLKRKSKTRIKKHGTIS